MLEEWHSLFMFIYTLSSTDYTETGGDEMEYRFKELFAIAFIAASNWTQISINNKTAKQTVTYRYNGELYMQQLKKQIIAIWTTWTRYGSQHSWVNMVSKTDYILSHLYTIHKRGGN